MEQLVLMKQLQDTNYYVNVLLLSSAANCLLHLEVQMDVSLWEAMQECVET